MKRKNSLRNLPTEFGDEATTFQQKEQCHLAVKLFKIVR